MAGFFGGEEESCLQKGEQGCLICLISGRWHHGSGYGNFQVHGPVYLKYLEDRLRPAPGASAASDTRHSLAIPPHDPPPLREGHPTGSCEGVRISISLWAPVQPKFSGDNFPRGCNKEMRSEKNRYIEHHAILNVTGFRSGAMDWFGLNTMVPS